MGNTAPTLQDFQAAYPALGSLALAPTQLALSTRLLGQDAWGEFWSDGILLDCAHNLTLANLAGGQANGALQAAAGPLSSVSVAGTNSGFNTPSPTGKSPSRDWYMKTSYGQMFLRLRDAVITPGYLAP